MSLERAAKRALFDAVQVKLARPRVAPAAKDSLRPAPMSVAASDAAAGAPVRLNPRDKFAGYVMRARWMTDDRYGPLRNASWLLRNSRVGLVYNPASLRLVVQEAETLLAAGDPLSDVLEAFAELLVHP